jgi:uncharacterized protein (TIGR00255 family)
MTGFAVTSRESSLGRLSLELRSVNHRYLEVSWKGPEELKHLEIPMRDAIQKSVSRGKVECRISFRPLHVGATGHPNPALLSNLSRWQAEVLRAIPQASPLSVNEILAWPGMLEREEMDTDQLSQEVMSLLQEGINELSATRSREGERLKEILVTHAERMEVLRKDVAPKIPELVTQYQARLTQKLRDALGHEEEDRVRQEVVVFAARVDIEEEIARLGVHLAEVIRVLEGGGAVGKRLDFLMQELNREANTLGSKSVASNTSQTALEMKVLIEQMREQIQNLE